MDVIFPDLTKADPPYNLSAPADWKVAHVFVWSVNQVVSQLHAAGVVHGDLHISTIAWRLCNDKVEMKILDWNTAFVINDHAPPAQVPQRLKDGCQSTNKWRGLCGQKRRVQELDLFMICVMRWGVLHNDLHSQGWNWFLDAATATSVGTGNVAFRDLQALYLSECSRQELSEQAQGANTPAGGGGDGPSADAATASDGSGETKRMVAA